MSSITFNWVSFLELLLIAGFWLLAQLLQSIVAKTATLVYASRSTTVAAVAIAVEAVARAVAVAVVSLAACRY